jgi:ParB family chromosome partitioning protein
MRHHEVGIKVGKSREFVSNTIRLLSLPEEIQEGLRQGLITEGHTRPLLSLSAEKETQIALYKEIIYRKMTVREAEEASRRLVKERMANRIREIKNDPESEILERQLSDALGTRVLVERRAQGKKISIEFFSEEELKNFLSKVGVNDSSVVEVTAENKNEDEVEQTEQIKEVEEVKKEEAERSWLKYFNI